MASASRPGKQWRVDLESFGFNGQCDCENFNFGCYADLSRGAKPSDDYRCKHIRDARSFVLDNMFPQIAKGFKGGPIDLARLAVSKMTLNQLVELQEEVRQRIEQLTNEDEGNETNTVGDGAGQDGAS